MNLQSYFSTENELEILKLKTNLSHNDELEIMKKEREVLRGRLIIARLDEIERKFVILKYKFKLTYAAIALELKVSQRTAYRIADKVAEKVRKFDQ